MKIKIFKTLIYLVSIFFLYTGCSIDGTVGPQGLDGQANIIYSQWYTPTAWNGETGDWYFDVTSADIDEDIVERGIILAYMSLPNDIYNKAVRPMPAYAIGCNWDFLIPDYGKIEFTSDSQNAPGTDGYYFRFVFIPPGTQLKSTRPVGYTKEELLQMPYSDVCKLLGIPE